MIYIFDVDGTLTPSRGRMNTEFALSVSYTHLTLPTKA